MVCPGGGFHILAQDLEGTEVAQWLNHQGITAVVLKYRVPTAPYGDELVAGAGNPNLVIPKKALGPVMDAQRALSVVHANAEKWELDPDKVGVMGFSAGGQTAVLAALADGISAYTKADEIDNSFCGASFVMVIYPGELVDEKTGELHEFAELNVISPPMFFAHAANDRVTCLSRVAMFAALKKVGVPAELHVYETGGHGYGLRATNETVTKWPVSAVEWLKNRGVLGN